MRSLSKRCSSLLSEDPLLVSCFCNNGMIIYCFPSKRHNLQSVILVQNRIYILISEVFPKDQSATSGIKDLQYFCVLIY